MASGQVNRIKRPDTCLHQPMLRNVKKVLANPEPSTHDPKRTLTRRNSSLHARSSACAGIGVDTHAPQLRRQRFARGGPQFVEREIAAAVSLTHEALDATVIG